jgi:hypothetical protein
MPAALQASKRRGADYWAFQVPKKVALPAVSNVAWTKNPIDYFILAKLDGAKLKPSPETSRQTLLRRASLDPDAYDRVVDRLLASQHYGERWGRHWLDLARYADSDGYTIDAPREIWKYRDWVIKALPVTYYPTPRRSNSSPRASTAIRLRTSKAASTSSSIASRPSPTAWRPPARCSWA